MKAQRWKGSLDDQLSRMIHDRLYRGDDHVRDGQRDRIHREINASAVVKKRHWRAGR